LIDVDHASERAVDAMLALAERQAPVQYPLMSGHNVVRGGWTTPPMRDLLKERYLTATQYRRLASLHGMAGIGGSRSRSDQWLNAYQATLTAMGLAAPSTLGAGAFGTDADGAEFMMPPSPRPGVSIDPRQAKPPIPPLPIFMDGNKIFDYNSQGVANYGLLPQFLQDVATLPGGQAVVERMFNGAQYFFDTWFIAERDKKL